MSGFTSTPYNISVGGTHFGMLTRALKAPIGIHPITPTDSNAHQYPQIFLEPSFALHEIELYERILAIAQPKSILHWQLTSDYSLLAGGGVYGDNGPLRPTQRFWI